jgi:ribosomal protein L44E
MAVIGADAEIFVPVSIEFHAVQMFSFCRFIYLKFEISSHHSVENSACRKTSTYTESLRKKKRGEFSFPEQNRPETRAGRVRRIAVRHQDNINPLTRIKSHLLFAGIIRSSPFSSR